MLFNRDASDEIEKLKAEIAGLKEEQILKKKVKAKGKKYTKEEITERCKDCKWLTISEAVILYNTYHTRLAHFMKSGFIRSQKKYGINFLSREDIDKVFRDGLFERNSQNGATARIIFINKIRNLLESE